MRICKTKQHFFPIGFVRLHTSAVTTGYFTFLPAWTSLICFTLLSVNLTDLCEGEKKRRKKKEITLSPILMFVWSEQLQCLTRSACFYAVSSWLGRDNSPKNPNSVTIFLLICQLKVGYSYFVCLFFQSTKHCWIFTGKERYRISVFSGLKKLNLAVDQHEDE